MFLCFLFSFLWTLEFLVLHLFRKVQKPALRIHAFTLSIPIVGWVYAWMFWWTMLLPRVIMLGWQHKKIALLVILAMIMSVFFHDHSNQISFHGLGPIRFVLVGFANFFYGIIDTVLHFGADVMTIPQKLDGCPPGESINNLVGFIIGAVVILYSWCIADTLFYWLYCHVFTVELAWGLAFVGFVYLAFLSGGKAGSHAPAAPKAAAGHH